MLSLTLDLDVNPSSNYRLKLAVCGVQPMFFLLSALAVVVARLVEAGWRSPKLRLPDREFDSLALHWPLHSFRTKALAFPAVR
jgi:hypothetical protein